jgi:hypothetical protein
VGLAGNSRFQSQIFDCDGQSTDNSGSVFPYIDVSLERIAAYCRNTCRKPGEVSESGTRFWAKIASIFSFFQWQNFYPGVFNHPFVSISPVCLS